MAKDCASFNYYPDTDYMCAHKLTVHCCPAARVLEVVAWMVRLISRALSPCFLGREDSMYR